MFYVKSSKYIDCDSCYVLHNGRKVGNDCFLEDGHIYHILPRVLGGKGGFGSMLRAIGAQIEKTTSREACRDLSGRRMRDVNNEKKLKDWVSKEADREREREERRQAKLAAQLAGPKHKFDDPEYHKQRSKVQDDLDDALQKGLKRAVGKNGDVSSSSQPRPSKKLKSDNKKEWLGMDIDSDDLESDSDNEANPGSPNMNATESQSTSKECIDNSNSSDSSEKNQSQDESHIASDVKVKAEEFSQDSESKSVAAPSVEVKEEIVNDDEPIDLDKVNGVDELSSMSLNRLKNALVSRGLKCGGTLGERAERLFSVKGLTPDQIPTSLMAKSKGVGKKSK